MLDSTMIIILLDSTMIIIIFTILMQRLSSELEHIHTQDTQGLITPPLVIMERVSTQHTGCIILTQLATRNSR